MYVSVIYSLTYFTTKIQTFQFTCKHTSHSLFKNTDNKWQGTQPGFLNTVFAFQFNKQIGAQAPPKAYSNSTQATDIKNLVNGVQNSDILVFLYLSTSSTDGTLKTKFLHHKIQLAQPSKSVTLPAVASLHITLDNCNCVIMHITQQLEKTMGREKP